ncbi:SDR family oxidoreductase [Streptomyces polygonati]|uniref:dTDP-4-dehydrorhamnose reductase n=1 Tax=Streptomyces polygonati TaxID=1617087 RepID=A0ABV8HKJ1_9ACTN
MRVLIVGSGFVGRAVAAELVRSGDEAVVASRRRPRDCVHPWLPLDATDAAACRRAVADAAPDRLVLVHGPSDVTWCEAHPEEASRGHAGATRALAEAAQGRRIVLISTDNVFDGAAPSNDERAVPRPANAYGAAKLRAEEALLALSDTSTVLRVSLVYGADPSRTGQWLNFFEACVRQLRRHEPVAAPDDHWTTPVLVDDVAAVTRAVLAGGSTPPLLHLGGPDRLTRDAWARLIAERLGLPAGLVVPTPRARSRYASRPENACLSSVLLDSTPATRGIRVRGVREGVRLLLPEGRPAADGTPR